MEIQGRIAEQFIKKIESEEITKDLRILICPIGLVGAGKSTVVIPLSKILKIPRISADEIRRVLKENGLDYSSLKDIANKIGKHFLDLGYGLILDQDLAGQLDLVKEITETYKLKTYFLHVNPPEEFILNKLRNYTGEKWLTDDQEKMVENYFSRKELHKDIEKKIKFDCTIDTSQPNLNKKIAEIAQTIRQKFL
jgi:predicted kinase